MNPRPRLPLTAWGRVERLLPGHRCTAVMPNGFRAEAHFDRRVPPPLPDLVPGDDVLLEFSTYDLSRPRILRIRPAPRDGFPESGLRPGPDGA